MFGNSIPFPRHLRPLGFHLALRGHRSCLDLAVMHRAESGGALDLTNRGCMDEVSGSVVVVGTLRP